jgi:DNA invertase Pin-like site-specific DNA recombinase
MKKAFAYLRVSGRGQIEGDGFTRQLTAIRQYAAANGYKIAKVYREEGVSGGTDWESRPAFSEMMASLLSNGTRTVLVERLDRVARDLMVQESVIADFQRKGLTLISVSEPDLLSDDPSRVLMRQMLGAFFQYEKTLLVAKLRGARQRIRAREGRCEGRKRYGTLPGEPEVIQRIRNLRNEGLALDKIADKLNVEGVKPRAGAKWYPTSVSRILSTANSPSARLGQ